MQSQTTTKQHRPEIPDKLYFRIGEVARLCTVPAYVLRFWETEFTQLGPNKSGTGQRLYRRRDVEIALRIKRLLYDEGYTIAGARQALQSEARIQAAEGPKRRKNFGQPQLPLPVAESSTQQTLVRVKSELRELLTLLSAPAATRARRAPRPGVEEFNLFQIAGDAED